MQTIGYLESRKHRKLVLQISTLERRENVLFEKVGNRKDLQHHIIYANQNHVTKHCIFCGDTYVLKDIYQIWRGERKQERVKKEWPSSTFH